MVPERYELRGVAESYHGKPLRDPQHSTVAKGLLLAWCGCPELRIAILFNLSWPSALEESKRPLRGLRYILGLQQGAAQILTRPARGCRFDRSEVFRRVIPPVFLPVH